RQIRIENRWESSRRRLRERLGFLQNIRAESGIQSSRKAPPTHHRKKSALFPPLPPPERDVPVRLSQVRARQQRGRSAAVRCVDRSEGKGNRQAAGASEAYV